MDREDILYLLSTLLIGGGMAFYSAPAGMIAIGVMLAIPPFISLFGINKKRLPK